MAEWIRLCDAAAFFDAIETEETLETIFLKYILRIRGEFCLDYTHPHWDLRSDPSEISREYILNSFVDFKNSTITANFSYLVEEDQINLTMFAHVEVWSAEIIRALKLLTPAKRGPRFTHNWDEIIHLANQELDEWNFSASQNKFMAHLRAQLKFLKPDGPIPDEATLKKKFANNYRLRKQMSGA